MPMNEIASIDFEKLTQEIDFYLKKLFPICRSLSGDGVRETIAILHELIDIDLIKIPSGTKCYDWTVPPEWNIKEAFILDSSGKRVIDFNTSNLHVVSYSIPVDRTMHFSELKKHLHTLRELPNAIPYRTSYYNRNWGFCLSQEDYEQFDKDGEYHVVINSSFNSNGIILGEKLIEGDSEKEFLVSTYNCHPSLANDNLSGQVLWAILFRELKSWKLHHSYRFIMVPETIGAIAYLNFREAEMMNIDSGL